ncbi:MAG: Diaminopimelate epimerase [Elusimicrobia bacterium]|nr:Diaminopimelate epimerase [Elusimicrobiota bacterium]
MKKIPFVKMHGAGNDFVFLNRDNFKGTVSPGLARRLLDRHFGIGGDQLLVLTPKREGGRPLLEFYNADGSQAEMCGNGTRAAALYLRDHKGVRNNFEIQTKTRLVGIRIEKGTIEVDMGRPVLEGSLIPVKAKGPIINRPFTVAGKTFKIHSVSMGNPHCVIFVRDVERFSVQQIGPLIENHPFFPKRVNVEFVEVMSPTHLKARVWERGAGETLACGSGACAILVASARFGKTRRSVKIDLPGGRLGVRWEDNQHVYLTGPTAITFKGDFFL